MRDSIKWCAGAAALFLASAAYTTAEAGNLDLPTAEYYSVYLSPGQSFRYTGSEEDVTLTVDDITYTVQIDPCDLFDRCEFFPESQITTEWNGPGLWEDSDRWDFTPGAPQSGTGGIGLFGQFSQTESSMLIYANQVIAKGAYLRMEMSELADGLFDAVSHTVYGQYAEKYKYDRDEMFMEMFYPTQRQLIEPGLAAPGTASPTAWAVATDAKAIGNTLSLSTWAVPTSESRHYQSPQIIQEDAGQNPNKVILSNYTGLTDFGTYTEAIAFVKGRVFIGTGGPVENHDVSVSTP